VNKDYTILIHTDTPQDFDRLEETLAGQWDALMTNVTTGDVWKKEGAQQETSTTAAASFEVVEECETTSDGWCHEHSHRVVRSVDEG